MEPPQFEVNFVQASDEGVVVSGLNCGAGIRTGDAFNRAYHSMVIRDDEGYYLRVLRSHERLILLKVTVIEVYNRQRSDELSGGMTGRLYLVGTGGDNLRAFDFLTTKDLGIHGHPTDTI